jgi:hypothetical protein
LLITAGQKTHREADGEIHHIVPAMSRRYSRLPNLLALKLTSPDLFVVPKFLCTDTDPLTLARITTPYVCEALFFKVVEEGENKEIPFV